MGHQITEEGALDVRCPHCRHYAMFHLDSGCTFREAATADHAPHMCECDTPIDQIVKRVRVAS